MELRKNLQYSVQHTTQLSLNSIWSSILICINIVVLSEQGPSRCPRQLFAVDNMSFIFIQCATVSILELHQTNVWIFNSTLNLALGKQRGD